MDRFIPARSAMDLDVANFNLLKENNGQVNSLEASPSKVRRRSHSTDCQQKSTPPVYRHVVQVEYKKRLAEGLGTENAPRILAFKNKVCGQ